MVGVLVSVWGGGGGVGRRARRPGGARRAGGGLREIRPLLYNISCVSKALTAMLPVVVSWLRVCLCVVLKEGGESMRRARRGEGNGGCHGRGAVCGV